MLGQRIYLARKSPQPITQALAIFAGLSMIPLLLGVILLNLTLTLSGLLLSNIFKTWLLNRMVWLYREVS